MWVFPFITYANQGKRACLCISGFTFHLKSKVIDKSLKKSEQKFSSEARSPSTPSKSRSKARSLRHQRAPPLVRVFAYLRLLRTCVCVCLKSAPSGAPPQDERSRHSRREVDGVLLTTLLHVLVDVFDGDTEDAKGNVSPYPKFFYLIHVAPLFGFFFLPSHLFSVFRSWLVVTWRMWKFIQIKFVRTARVRSCGRVAQQGSAPGLL